MAKRTGRRQHPGDATAAGFRCSNPACPLSPQPPEAGAGQLLALRDQFLKAVEGIDAAIAHLRGDEPTTREPGASVRDAQIEARGASFGALLDFQERVAALPGVTRVSISAVDSERATLDVKFEEPAP